MLGRVLHVQEQLGSHFSVNVEGMGFSPEFSSVAIPLYTAQTELQIWNVRLWLQIMFYPLFLIYHRSLYPLLMAEKLD